MVTLTDNARQRAQQFLASQPDALGLRFGVRKTGCSGWGYDVEVAREIAAGDTVYDAAGVTLVIDATSLPLVDGTEIDFVRQGLNQSFVFRNPNAKAECGCGESFTTDRDATL